MLSLYKKNSTSFLGFFFLYFFLEICLGGAGTIFSFGSFTLRKINFTLGVLFMAYLYVVKQRINRNVANITLLFLLLLVLSTVVGFLHYGNNAKVSENLLMQSFFLILPLYALFINTTSQIDLFTRMIRFSALILAFCYLILLVLIFFDIIPFITVYESIEDSQEFFGRGESAFWYKGFLYLCIGVFFLSTSKHVVLKRVAQIFIWIAIILTFTRGFILAIFITGLIFNVFFKKIVYGILIVISGLILYFSFGSAFQEASFDRTESDQVRYLQIDQVKSRVTPTSFIIGNGFGEGVPIRDNHMEINYLEIFHKQGLIGLIFWIFILTHIIVGYLKIRENSEFEIKLRPFVLSSFFVFFQSLTNPFLTNSIGMNIIMATIVAIEVLKRNIILNAS